jgi:hypothetical protein
MNEFLPLIQRLHFDFFLEDKVTQVTEKKLLFVRFFWSQRFKIVFKGIKDLFDMWEVRGIIVNVSGDDLGEFLIELTESDFDWG